MNERERLLRRIQEEDFTVYETVLYLDGHPRNRKALMFYDEHRKVAKALRAEYEKKYGPMELTETSYPTYMWDDGPWPFIGGGI